MYFLETPFARCGYSVHFPLDDGEDPAMVSFEGPLPGEYQDINRAELFAAMKLMVSVTDFNVKWYSDSKYTLQGIKQLLENPAQEALTERPNVCRDMWVMAAEIVTHFNRFFKIECQYVPAHVDDEEVGSRITQFEFEGNRAADNAAKKGTRMHSDFIEVDDGLRLAEWEDFQNLIDSQVLEREEAHHPLLCDGEEARPADLTKLKVPELKQLCRDRGLKVGGNKPELIARLEG